jgi:hypothetical protein
MSHSTDADSHIRMSTQPYEYTHPTHMSTSERLNRLDLEVYKVGHQERLVVNKYVAYH